MSSFNLCELVAICVQLQWIAAFFSARQHAERAICTRKSVSLSVCLSVTRVYQSKTAEVRIMQFSPYMPSSFCRISFIQKF